MQHVYSLRLTYCCGQDLAASHHGHAPAVAFLARHAHAHAHSPTASSSARAAATTFWTIAERLKNEMKCEAVGRLIPKSQAEFVRAQQQQAQQAFSEENLKEFRQRLTTMAKLESSSYSILSHYKECMHTWTEFERDLATKLMATVTYAEKEMASL